MMINVFSCIFPAKAPENVGEIDRRQRRAKHECHHRQRSGIFSRHFRGPAAEKSCKLYGRKLCSKWISTKIGPETNCWICGCKWLVELVYWYTGVKLSHLHQGKRQFLYLQWYDQ